MRLAVLVGLAVAGCAPSVPPMSDPVGTTGGQTSETGGDSESEDEDRERRCLHPEDEPASETLCRRAGIDCGPLTACPPNYGCDQGECVCDDLEACGYTCSLDEHCPQGAACDHQSGVCRPPLSCLFDDNCDNGELCVKDRPWEDLNADRRCAVPGDSLPGDACDVGYECSTGVCLGHHTCLPSCRTQSDCPAADLACGQEASGKLGCRLSADIECGLDCALTEHCDPVHGCVTPCRSTSDCDEGTCILSTYNPSRSRCEPEATPCEPDEFGFTDGHDDTQQLCFIQTPCWTDLDCAPPYGCEIPKTSSNNIAFTAGFCARAP